MNQWLHPGAMSAHNCPHKDHTTLITSLVTCCADKIRFFKGWSSPLRPLCTLHVPPKATQACPIIFRLLILTDGYNCYSDGFLHFFCYLFCQLHSLVTRFPSLCNSLHAHLLLQLQLALHFNNVTTLSKLWESWAAAKSATESKQCTNRLKSPGSTEIHTPVFILFGELTVSGRGTCSAQLSQDIKEVRTQCQSHY